MCGRFTRSRAVAEYAKYFDASPVDAATPDFNVSPADDVLAVVAEPDQSRHLLWLHWGLVPSWSRGPDRRYSMINARAETLGEKPAFRAAFRKRRCLIVADGFYEWAPIAAGKQPYYIRLRSGEPMGLAGIWETWESGDGGEVLHSAAIITTGANTGMLAIHDRMPLILAREHVDFWLDPHNAHPETRQEILAPLGEGQLEYYPVSTRVNSPTHNDASLIKPL